MTVGVIDPWSRALMNSSRFLSTIFACLVIVYVVLCALPIAQVDLWWQLTEGLRMLHTFHLPTAPAAAFGFPASPYFDEYAGYEVTLALLYRLSGFWGLWFLFVSVYLLLVFLPSQAFGRRLPKFDLLSTASILVAALLFKFRFEQRPEFIGELFLVLLFLVLCRLRLEAVFFRNYLYLFVIFVAWSNTHSSFVIGFFALSLWMATELVFKANQTSLSALGGMACLLALVTISASVVNPYGAERLLFPFQQAVDPGATVLSVEMWPLSDLHSVLGMLVLTASALILMAFLSSRQIPVWLMLFSLFSLYMAFKNVRFVNLLAISLLFVNACREARTMALQQQPSNFFALSKVIFLIAVCAIALLWDILSLTSLSEDPRHPTMSAMDNTFFDPMTAGMAHGGDRAFIPVLCEHGEGSYLSFPPSSPLHPILDSGLAHFSDAMKRYFLFVSNDPLAFRMATTDLQVSNIVIDRGTFPWTLSLCDTPGWRFVSCDKNGQLWEKLPFRKSPAIDSTEAREIQALVDQFVKANQYRSAFCYSALLKNTTASLRLLVRCRDAEWSDSLFNFVVDWVSSRDERDLREFLQGNHQNDYPLADAILWARLGPEPYEHYLTAVDRPMANSWQWNLTEARVHLMEGNRINAEQAFDSIATPPIASIGYYSMWQELKGAASAPANGRWQMWNVSAHQFVLATTKELNQRIAILQEASSR